MVKIYLDAGHGGKDTGAIGNGLYEKNVTLQITKKIGETLKNNYKNVDVMYTRTSDVFLGLSERADKANNWGADAFVSVHINSATSSAARGFESYIYPDVDSATVAFQNTMHQQIYNSIKNSGVTDRGKKRADFAVVRESLMKAILTENLFISSPSDAALLKNDAFINNLAQGHVLGLEKFFGLERTARPPNNDTGELFQVIAGTFSDYDNAESMVQKLKKDGYESYINKK